VGGEKKNFKKLVIGIEPLILKFFELKKERIASALS
jgi:hypothetical protein